MKWQKLGLVWAPQGEPAWTRTHATLPIARVAGANEWWVYVGCRDEHGKTRIARVVLDTSGLPAELPTVRQVVSEPVLSLGEPGTFDDSGVMPAWLVDCGDELRMYYIGWNVIATVPYRLSMGLAISNDAGRTFRRYSQGPILDRNLHEPFFVTSPCVHRENDRWRMWYVSCTGWESINGRWEPVYHVKYAESRDGIDWRPTGISCIKPDDGFAIARPCVFRNGEKYAMLYPIRSTADYRTQVANAYRFGYAESDDGLHWQRLDERVGIHPSAKGWDSQMVEYSWLQPHNGEVYLLYNGNGFGHSGFGLARLESWE